MKNMNLPNKLTLLRLFVVPIYTVLLLLPIDPNMRNIIAAILFFITAMTDFLDGHIARKYRLVTDFGKFLDPVADKIMIFGALLGLMFISSGNKPMFISLIAASFIFFLREIGVTTLRMVAKSKEGVVIAAGILGKIKTVSQIAFVMSALLEPVIFGGITKSVITYVTMAFMTIMTVVSGIGYVRTYLPLINTDK